MDGVAIRGEKKGLSGLINNSYNLLQHPHMIRNLRFHRWGYPQSPVNPARIIVHEMKSNGIFKVLDLFAKAVR
jgi:hypothetical protein